MNIFIVIGKEDCNFCVKALKKIDLNGDEYAYLDVYKPVGRYDSGKIAAENWSGKKITQVPQIFLNGDHIGGFEELEKYYEER